jgi:hypothetical protein
MINLTAHFEITRGEKERILNFTLSSYLNEPKKISELKEQFKNDIPSLKSLNVEKFDVLNRKDILDDNFIIDKTYNLVCKVTVS